MDWNSKTQSPYPALQALLPRLSALNPRNEFKPVFRTRDEAEQFIAVLDASDMGLDRSFLNPVWAINHKDLNKSMIAGWSVTDYMS